MRQSCRTWREVAARFAAAIALFAFFRMAPADELRARPATGVTIARNDSSLSRGELALDDDENEMVPISRLAPRTKTIPPGHDVAHRLPANYQEIAEQLAEEQEAGELADDEAGMDEMDEADAPPPIDEGPRRAIKPLRPRAKSVSVGVARRVAAEPADSSAAFIDEESPAVEPPAAGLDGGPPAAPIPALTPEPLFPEVQPGVVPTAEPWLEDPEGYDSSYYPPQGVDDCHCWGPLKKFLYFNQTNGDIGIGHERVMFAPFEIETSQPQNNFRVRVSSAFNLQTPDRAEYIWAKIGGGGPALPETRVNYQQFDAIYEAGGNRFSLVTDIPMRNVDPQVNASGAGLGNISLAPKMVLVNGSDWQISSIFRTYLPTGGAQRGTSNGLTSLEPGVLVRYRWSPRTFVHGQLKYWIPLGADPIASGNAFNYGLGVSHVLHETDTFAIIPVLEFVGWNVGGGTATLPSGLTTSASTDFVNILPGVRFVLGPKGDLGLCEVGVNGGFCTNVTGWYREQFTVEIRWSW